MNGNKITKVLAVLICAFMLIQCTAIGTLAADIDPEAVVYVRPEVTDVVANQVGMNYVYVDVMTEGSDNDQTVMVYLTDGGELLTLGYAPIGSNKAEVKLGVPDDVDTGTYTLVTALNKALDVYKSKVFYIGVEDVTGFFEAINMADVEVSTVKEKLDAHYEALAVIECTEDEEGNIILKLTGDDYKSLTEKAKDAFAKLILNGVNGKYTEGKGSFAAENSEDFVKEAYIVAAYNADGLSDKAMANLLYKFSSVIGFDAQDENLYGKIQNTDTLAKVVKTIDKTVNNVEELKTALEQAAVVQIVNETHWLNLVNVVNENNDLFKVDEDEIEKLLDSKSLRTAFCEEFQNTYYSVKEIRDAWEVAYKAAKKEVGSTGGGGGGGGGGGSTTTTTTTTTVVHQVNTQVSQDENQKDINVEIRDYYTDISDTDYYWASDAILNLTKAQIVAGYGDKTFGPANSVTRAEFMKMVINVLGMADITATTTFTDVDPSAWYYIYVASAEKLGLAQGYGNGLFGVNDPVTRQDAITIVYRAAKLKGLSLEKFTASIDKFVDKASIAPYAQEAVSALHNAGVFLDASDPTRVDVFEPTRNASRAYLAVILDQIYRYMK